LTPGSLAGRFARFDLLFFSPKWSKIPASMAKRKAKKPATSRKARPAATAKLRKDAVTLVVILRAKEGQEGLLEAELRALMAPTRREDGCLTYDLHRALDIPGAFLLHEVWATREHHRLHTKTPHFLRWDARKDALLAARDATFWQQPA
jgi:quinol monooxygenase YgiN